jgi:hypothetical protein
MSLVGEMGSRVPKRRSAADLLYDELSPGAGESYLSRSINSLTSAAMPQFNQQLQDTRENAIRRGVSGGGLGTSYEGDVFSAFQRNVSNTAGAYANENYNRYLEMLSGTRDYETYLAEQKRKRKGGLFGALGSIAGGIGGFILSPPGLNLQGAAAGAKIGGSIGGGIGGY